MTEERLLKLAGAEADLFSDPSSRLADAYRRRAWGAARTIETPG
jgi:hypothetical protein